MFGRWKLKFLDDPKNIYGSKEESPTIVRKGLKDDMLDVYKFLDKFHWKTEELKPLMIWIKEDDDMYPGEKILRYMRYHPDQVQSWIE